MDAITEWVGQIGRPGGTTWHPAEISQPVLERLAAESQRILACEDITDTNAHRALVAIALTTRARERGSIDGVGKEETAQYVVAIALQVAVEHLARRVRTAVDWPQHGFSGPGVDLRLRDLH